MDELKYILIFVTALAGAIGTFLDVYKDEDNRKSISSAGMVLVGLIILTLVFTVYLQKLENDKKQEEQKSQSDQHFDNLNRLSAIAEDLKVTLESSQNILKTIGKINELTIHVLYRQEVNELGGSLLKEIFDDIVYIEEGEICVSGFHKYKYSSKLDFVSSFNVHCDENSNAFYLHYWPKKNVESFYEVPSYWKKLVYGGIIVADREGTFDSENIVFSERQFLDNVYIDFTGDYESILETEFGPKKPMSKLSYYPREGIMSLHVSNKKEFVSENQAEGSADTPFNTIDLVNTNLYLGHPVEIQDMEPYLVLLTSDNHKRVTYHLKKMKVNIRDQEGNVVNLQMFKLEIEKNPYKAFEYQAANHSEITEQ